jgi:5-methylcytosine-specific restriction protein A
MTIPADDVLKSDLLAFLAAEPDTRASVWRVYEQLALRHPEVTHAERTQKYSNSASHWANRVQFARLHLVNQGMLFRANGAPDAPRSQWKLTPKGVEAARVFQSSAGPTESQVAADLDAFAQEEEALEGLRSERLVAHFERNPKLRAAAIAIHGTTCRACDFNFAANYGSRGKDYIEVHHLVPVSRMTEPSSVNPRTDMTVLCANCHRMVHRSRDKPLSLQELVEVVRSHRISN